MEIPLNSILLGIGGGLGYAEAKPAAKDKIKGTALGAGGAFVGAGILRKGLREGLETGKELGGELGILKKVAELVTPIQERIAGSKHRERLLASSGAGMLAGIAASSAIKNKRLSSLAALAGAAIGSGGMDEYLKRTADVSNNKYLKKLGE